MLARRLGSFGANSRWTTRTVGTDVEEEFFSSLVATVEMKRGSYSWLSAQKGLAKRNKAAFAEAASTEGKIRIGPRPPLSPVQPAQPRCAPSAPQVEVITLPDGSKTIVLAGSSSSSILDTCSVKEERALGIIESTEGCADDVAENAENVENAYKEAVTDDDDDDVDIDAISGSCTLPRVVRGTGIAPSQELRSLLSAHGRSQGEIYRCLAGDDLVASVELSAVLKHLDGWVSPCVGAEKFSEWLRCFAPAFPSLRVPSNLAVMFDEERASSLGELREFVSTLNADTEGGGGGEKFNSPLSPDESNFHRLQFSAVQAAARVLGTSDENLLKALQVARSQPARRYAMRATYMWIIRCHDSGRVLVYIGESKDAETRISTHLISLFSKADDDRSLQKGHRAAREQMGALVGECEMRLFVISAHDADSAQRLAQSYVEFCRRTCGGKIPSILETARACAASGFFSEAVWTAAFRSLHEESTVHRIGLNFSQPGLIFPSGKYAKVPFAQRLELGASVRGILFFCDCHQGWVRQNRQPYQKPDGDSVLLKCKACYDAERTESQAKDSFICNGCGLEKKGKRVRDGDAASKYLCNRCYEHRRIASMGDFTCAHCKEVKQGKRIRQADGFECCNACYHKL